MSTLNISLNKVNTINTSINRANTLNTQLVKVYGGALWGGISGDIENQTDLVEYIRNSISGLAPYFFLNTASDISGYKNMDSTPVLSGLQSITTSNVTNGQVLATFATELGLPNIDFLPSGVAKLIIHASQTTGTKTVELIGEIYKRTSLGVETLIAFTSFTQPISRDAVMSQYNTDTFIQNAQFLDVTDRIIVKIKASVTGTGSAPTVVLGIEDETASRLELPIAQSNIPYIPEDTNNKKTNFTTKNDTTYPTTLAVSSFYQNKIKVTVGNSNCDYNTQGLTPAQTVTKIQEAIDSVRVTGGCVIIRDPVTVNSCITVHSNITLIVASNITTTTLRHALGVGGVWLDNMGVIEIGDRATKPITYNVNIIFENGAMVIGDYFNVNAVSYPQDRANTNVPGAITDPTIPLQREVSAVHSYCTLVNCHTWNVYAYNMVGAVRHEALGQDTTISSKNNSINNTLGEYCIVVVEAYTNGYTSNGLNVFNTTGNFCIDDIVAIVGAGGGKSGANGRCRKVLVSGVFGQKNGLRGSGVKIDGGETWTTNAQGQVVQSGKGEVVDITVDNVVINTSTASLPGVFAQEFGCYIINGHSIFSKNIHFSNIKLTGTWRVGGIFITSGINITANGYHAEALYGFIFLCPNLPSDLQYVDFKNVVLLERNGINNVETTSIGVSIMGGSTVQGFKNISIQGIIRWFNTPLAERGIFGIGQDGTIINPRYNLDIDSKNYGDLNLNDALVTNRSLKLSKFNVDVGQYNDIIINQGNKYYLNTTKTAWIEFDGTNIKATKNNGANFTNII